MTGILKAIASWKVSRVAVLYQRVLIWGCYCCVLAGGRGVCW